MQNVVKRCFGSILTYVFMQSLPWSSKRIKKHLQKWSDLCGLFSEANVAKVARYGDNLRALACAYCDLLDCFRGVKFMMLSYIFAKARAGSTYFWWGVPFQSGLFSSERDHTNQTISASYFLMRLLLQRNGLHKNVGKNTTESVTGWCHLGTVLILGSPQLFPP